MGFASVPHHPIWLEVIEAVTKNIFKELQLQLSDPGYTPRVGKLPVLSMTGPMAMTNTMNLTIHQYEHVATDSFKQLGWDYDMVQYKTGNHMANANKAMFGHKDRKHYSNAVQPIVLKVPTEKLKLESPVEQYVIELCIDENILPEIQKMNVLVRHIMQCAICWRHR